MGGFHLAESASALHYGLEVEDEDDCEVRQGECLLTRLGKNEVGTAKDLPLPEDASAHTGELFLLVRPEGGDGPRRGGRANFRFLITH